MGTLRERLRTTIPELFTALERSWEIAHREWLPAIPPSLDSFNSYPHLRNLEGYLEGIAADYEELHHGATPSLLSPVEIYVTLSAILFHDIGRVYGSAGHGARSRSIILEEYASLGIPSIALAEPIAKIAAFHDLPPRECQEWLQRHLGTIAVGSYGDIRQRVCAGLLFLVDHLDGAFTRVLPVYVRPAERAEVVGAFRRAVRSVAVDLRAQMVKVVLSSDLEKGCLSSDTARAKADQFVLSLNESALPHDQAHIAKVNKAWQLLADARPEAKKTGSLPASGQSIPAVLTVRDTERLGRPEVAELCSEFDFSPERVTPVVDRKGTRKNSLHSALKLELSPEPDYLWLTARGLLHATRRRARGSPPDANRTAGVEAAWPRELLLAVIIGNTWENVEALQPVKSTLAAAGVPLKAWLIEYDEHLYNAWGQETYEPILHRGYLLRTARAMWKLSASIFAHNTLSYEALAAEMRDPDTERVRRAVRRLSIVSTSPAEARAENALWVGQLQWKWAVVSGTRTPRRCEFTPLRDIEDALSRVWSPMGENE